MATMATTELSDEQKAEREAKRKRAFASFPGLRKPRGEAGIWSEDLSTESGTEVVEDVVRPRW